MIVNFIKDNRFPKFINQLTSNSLNQTDSTYVDTSPNGIFDGDIGTVLIKDGIDILYKTNNDTEINKDVNIALNEIKSPDAEGPYFSFT